MSLEKDVRAFAKKRSYSFKELCTGRYELSRDYEIMTIRAIIDGEEEKVMVSTSPKIVPLLLVSAVLLAGLPPLIILVYIFYASMSYIRTKSVKKDIKNMKW